MKEHDVHDLDQFALSLTSLSLSPSLSLSHTHTHSQVPTPLRVLHLISEPQPRVHLALASGQVSLGPEQHLLPALMQGFRCGSAGLVSLHLHPGGPSVS